MKVYLNKSSLRPIWEKNINTRNQIDVTDMKVKRTVTFKSMQYIQLDYLRCLQSFCLASSAERQIKSSSV